MQREIIVGGRRIEAAWHGPAPDQAPTLVLLHEGLGCVAMWSDFPAKLAERTGYGVLAYSRPGYGKSDPVPLPRPLTYMHDEAFDVIPAILDQAKIEKAILVGHSDGASIATIYARRPSGFPRARPGADGAAFLRRGYFGREHRGGEGSLRDGRPAPARSRAITATMSMSRSGAGTSAWLHPDFRDWRIDECPAHVRVPMLIIQGRDDQYGTAAQIELAQAASLLPGGRALSRKLRHSPQVDQPEATLEAIAAFAHRILTVHEGAGAR